MAEPPPQPERSSLSHSRPRDIFVGRQREMAELTAALEDALAGQGRLVMLVGEPGIGKTRTAQELASHAAARGAQVLWGWCYEEVGAPPFWPWVQPIRLYVQQTDSERLRFELGPGAAEIADIVPEIRAKIPGLAIPPELEPEQARFRLFDSITTFLKKAAQSQPLMLVLDDLHWADQSSLLLLQFLARELALTQSAPLLVVGCYRDVELSRQHPLSETLAQLSRTTGGGGGGFQRVVLRGLDQDDTAQFIEAGAGVKPTPGLVETIFSHTEGNPFFMSEVIRLLLANGDLTSEGVGTTEGLRIPEGVREVIGQRLNRLSEQCNQALTTASIIGRDFDFQLLFGLSDGITEDQLLTVIDEAAEFHLIEGLPGRSEAYRFSHALIQQTLSEELSPSRKVRLHARIAQVLEVMYGDSAESHAPELAHHFAEAQLVLGSGNVVRYSRLAGEQSFANYAYEEALSHFQRGLAAKSISLAGTQPATDAEAAELLYGLGRAQLAMLRLDEGWATLGRAFDYYAEFGNFSRIVDIADRPIDIQVPGAIAPLLARALDLVPPASLEEGRLLAWHGRLLSSLHGDYDGAQEALSRALDIAQREGDSALELQTVAYAADVAGWELQWDQCLEKALQAIDLTGNAENAFAESTVHMWVSRSLAAMGQDRERAQRHALAALAAADRLHDRVFLPRTLGIVSVMFCAWGDWQTARELTNRGLALAPNSQGILPVRTILEYQVGDFGQGEAYMERDQVVISMTDDDEHPRRASNVLTTVARITGVTASLDTAEKANNAVLASTSATPIFTYAASVSLGLIAVLRGDVAAAGRHYSALEQYRGTMLLPNIWWTSADRMLGLLAHTMGNLDQSAEHFEEALVFCRRAGYRPELGWTCCDYADMLLARAHSPSSGSGRTDGADSAKAIALLEESLAIATELGMRPLVERVNQRTAQAQALPETAPAYPDGLTEREVEVLRLIAAGKTNLEIAEELVIAEGTARRHVANIYEKIGAVNRAEATRYALRERLLALDEIASADP